MGAVLGSMVQMLVRPLHPVCCHSLCIDKCARPSLPHPLPLALQQEQPSVRLLKHIIRCYLRLSENARARECLRQCFPDQLRDPSFVACLKDDQTTRRWLQQLLVQMGQTDVVGQ